MCFIREQLHHLFSRPAIEAEEVAVVCRPVFVGDVLPGTLLGAVCEIALDTSGIQLAPCAFGRKVLHNGIHAEEEPLLDIVVLVDKQIRWCC